MSTRIITSEECEALTEWPGLIAALADAHRALASGGAVQPVPEALRIPGDASADGPAAVPMVAFAPYLGLASVKLLIDAPRNRASGLPPQRSTVSLYSADTAECLALIDGRALTRLRTAAVSALATSALARPDSRILTLVGAGPLAREHALALGSVVELEEVRVWSPSGSSATALAAELVANGVSATAPEGLADAVRGSDVVCTLTPSVEPLLDAAWLTDGVHVNAVGSPPRHGYRELGADVFARADRVVVDTRGIAFSESDNVRRSGLRPADVAELGEVLTGRTGGRSSRDDVTVFNSVGIGLQDLAAGAHVLARAERAALGVEVETRAVR
ncbi:MULTISPECIES: ornithine cyclodeaminase family protein [unclassified Rathayibacter]|uniref:ornithine cyclodeaminase family protein n=1 Tax=unclassified Rathayibacter TaxID=2609250 RepID=UPI001FB36CAB|nr:MULTISPECIES: ornithine cyclodeaminase family protein [unclassified Rathayibacter]MCJ1674017.1 ornithine cyclodeaminase family protein [Rathayibacter sp. VKM Ac-2929]MCJ1685191.1 ornithine cyclodeaminase family protein [Rathayibacter sp. VKM Ac-2928]